MLKILRALTLVERVIAGLLVVAILVSTFQIGDAFYNAHATVEPGNGGTYVEGVTGNFQFLNPVLAKTDLDRDVTSLVFCGLTRFDPVANAIVDDVADHTLSADQKTYTFTIKDGAKWHDGEPVTADDIVFTFRDVIQKKEFPNPTLAADFADVTVTKIDERTATLTLKRKYAFFVYNTTVGLLPAHLLKDIPVADLPSLEYNLKPIGCGPYTVDSVTASQIRLAANVMYYGTAPHLDTIVFRMFGSEEQLFKNLDGLTGTKDLSAKYTAGLANDARFALHEFTLPQYVALFFNLERPTLRDKKTRLGLQLATDKETLIKSLATPAHGLDTPLLEIANSDWKYDFSAERADGALFDAGWRYPAAATLTTTPATSTTPTTLEPRTPNPEPTTTHSAAAATNEFISTPTNARYYATGEKELYLRGTAPTGTTAIIVNGYQIKKFVPGTTWTYKASTAIGTLKNGENEFIVTAVVAGAKKEIGRTMIYLAADEAARTTWLAEKTGAAKSTETPTAQPTTTDANEKPVETATPTETKSTATTDAKSAMNSPKTTAAATSLEPRTPNLTPKTRINAAGQPLALHLLALADNEEYVSIAKLIQKQWAARGVAVTLDLADRAAFIERLAKNDFDVALSGQNLGYNLDAYAFWHSSEARPGGANLSNLRSPAVNAWLEQIRTSFNSTERRKRLANLRDALAEEVPAIVLYTPVYRFVIDQKIKGFNLGHVALLRDRFANATGWYLREARALTPDTSAWTFVKWLVLEGFKLPTW